MKDEVPTSMPNYMDSAEKGFVSAFPQDEQEPAIFVPGGPGAHADYIEEVRSVWDLPSTEQDAPNV
jgi:hypothetical protein